MEVKIVNRGDTGELILSGRLETGNAEEMSEIFLAQADRFQNITLNMMELRYISSAGLRAIMKLYMKVNENGGELNATNVNAFIKETMELTGFSGLLHIS